MILHKPVKFVIEEIVTDNVDEDHRMGDCEWRRKDAEVGNWSKTPNALKV